jgi:SAM-dependent methyltransferase
MNIAVAGGFEVAPLHKGAIHPAALAWFGNAAKMRVIQRLIEKPGPLTVLDYGAGTGGAWQAVLDARPDIALFCFEPCTRGREAFRRNVPSATILGDRIETVELEADVIVSFSVLEHVYDRAAYLGHCRRLLRPGCTLFLNYDDGHFRTPGSRTEALRNRLAPILPWVGLKRHYQASVTPAEANRLVAGFAVTADRYENLPSLKALAPTITPSRRAAFARYWLDTEDALNAEFSGPDLWQVAASRTLELVPHAVTR